MSTSEGLPPGARAQVVTVSDRSHGGARHDASGPLLAELLTGLGFEQVSNLKGGMLDWSDQGLAVERRSHEDR